MKGQLFTTDVLASVLIVTIIIAFTTWELEQVYNRASDIQFEKLNSLATDIAQMAVKNILANRTMNGTILANSINESRWDLLTAKMDALIIPPVAYEAVLNGPTVDTTLSEIGNGGCSYAKTNAAVARRVVYYYGGARELSIKVCA